MAQRRVRDEVLGWGGTRPVVPSGLVVDLARTLARAVAGGLPATAPGGQARQRVTASALARLPGSGPPGAQDAATVRGRLLAAVVADDLAAGHAEPVASLVARAVTELASGRHGDPGSASHWWNGAEAATRAAIRAEVAAVAAQLRTVWPPLDPAEVQVTVRPRLAATVTGRPVVLQARPLVVLDSPRRDERARSIVLVARTGMPRPREDRLLARVTALIATLAAQRPPFRWGVLHVTEGRFEVEDLDPEVLLATAATAGARVGTVLAGAAGSQGDAGTPRRR
ncbi:MAG: hypothetical protein ACLFUG_00905 [Nitriliruptoraceae bacterium]